MILLDTNVLIEILKNDEATIAHVSELPTPLAVSSITAMELFYGAINKDETRMLARFLDRFRLVHVDEMISSMALQLVRRYAKSHNLDIPDALIAATAIHLKVPLMTYNVRDFRFIPALELA